VTHALQLLGGPAHVVFDCVSRESSVRQAVELASKGGKIMVVGVASPEISRAWRAGDVKSAPDLG